MKKLFETFLAQCPAVAILRGITNAEVPAVCDVLYDAGIRLLEIPLNSPNAVESIAIAARHCAGRQMAVIRLMRSGILWIVLAVGTLSVPDCCLHCFRENMPIRQM